MLKINLKLRKRESVLYLGLFWILGCAWISDRWHQIRLEILILAALGVAGELVFAHATAGQSEEGESQVTQQEGVESLVVSEQSTVSEEAPKPPPTGEIARMTPSEVMIFWEKYLSSQPRYRKVSNVSALSEYITQQTAINVLPDDLQNWTFKQHKPGVFTVTAGAFEITQSAGQINITVHDRSKVTVVAWNSSKGQLQSFNETGTVPLRVN